MLRRPLPMLLFLVVLALPASAGATVRGGSAPDPREGITRGDAAAASVRHDDVTGDLTLVVRLHDAAPEDAPAASWVLGGAAPGPRGCDLAGVFGGVEYALETGEAQVEVRTDAADDAAVVPARVTRSADRREVRVDARDARLAGRPILCAQVQLGGGDEVVPIALTEAGAAGVAGPDTAPGAPGAGPGAGSAGPGAGSGAAGGSGSVPGAGGSAGAGSGPSGAAGASRVGRVRVAASRRGRTTTVTVRARVCTARGRIRLTAVERRTRRTGSRRAVTVRHRFTRTQRARCQEHRLTWRFRSAAAYRVTARLSLARPAR